MDSLFADLPTDDESTIRHEGLFTSVAIEDSLDKLLDYSVPAKFASALRVGQRVKVPLGRGNRATYGYVIAIANVSSYPRVKPILDIEDERVLLNEKMMELARWMSRYYCSPLGSVIDSIIPAAVKKKTGLGYLKIVRLTKTVAEIQDFIEKTKRKKQQRVMAHLLQLPHGSVIDAHRLADECECGLAVVKSLQQGGYISITEEADLPGFTADCQPTGGTETDMKLNEDQQKVIDELLPRVKENAFSVNLLLGVTGSGKTEVYLQCIREVVARGKQAIVMVPEIALTPQTVRRFTLRFPRIAILHSGLSNTDRHRYWQQIATGQADVIIGARSAVFAPVPNLGMMIVDEEHESSYKQDSSPRYHGRDVAIMRSKIENVPVLLGSATPSLESYHRAYEGESKAAAASPDIAKPVQHLLELPRRVRGLSMPKVELIDMRQEQSIRKSQHLISMRLEKLLKETLALGQQAIILLNRRGYSNFVYCPSCQSPMHCKYCDTTMTYHRSVDSDARNSTIAESVHTGQMHCHYCLAIKPLPPVCPDCKKKLTLFGLGTQKVEEELLRKFPDLKYARVDSDTMHTTGQYESILAQFANKEIDVMLGTQVIAKGLDYPNVTLVGVVSGDTALALPDFRAAERTFQLITQVAGRAGRGDQPGRVVLQTFLPEDPTIQAALKQDYVGFANVELGHRRSTHLPPFGRMVRIVVRDQELPHLEMIADELSQQLAHAIAAQGNKVEMNGPAPAAIARIAGYYRYQIILKAPRSDSLQNVLAKVREEGRFAKTDRIAVDVDPVSLL